MLHKLKPNTRKIAVGASLITAGYICAYLAFGFMQDRHRLNFVPPILKVSKVLYSKEDSWGFGPGGNEAGVVVFELPVESVAALSDNGITYLKNSASDFLDDSRSNSWHPTPVLLEGSDADTNHTMSFEVNDFLNRYGFGIDIDPKVRHAINSAVSEPGNFVSYQRSGILIVVPSLRRIFYIYNG